MINLRKYGVATRVYFPLIDKGATDFEATPVTIAAGDCKVSKDGGAFSNTGSNFAHLSSGAYYVDLTAAEMEAAKIIIIIKDQTATKEWEDQMVLIETYGHASAQHEMDLDSPLTAFPFKKNTAFSNFTFVMIDSTDDMSPKTGLTITAQRCIDGGSFASCDNAASEVGNGVYKINLSAADLNGNSIQLRFTATGANPTLIGMLLPN